MSLHLHTPSFRCLPTLETLEKMESTHWTRTIITTMAITHLLKAHTCLLSIPNSFRSNSSVTVTTDTATAIASIPRSRPHTRPTATSRLATRWATPETLTGTLKAVPRPTRSILASGVLSTACRCMRSPPRLPSVSSPRARLSLLLPTVFTCTTPPRLPKTLFRLNMGSLPCAFFPFSLF